MRDNITEIQDELIRLGVPEMLVSLLIAELIAIGARAAVYRRETADAVAELMVDRTIRERMGKR